MLKAEHPTNHNFGGTQLFESIFECASQKEHFWNTFEKWKLSDWPEKQIPKCPRTIWLFLFRPIRQFSFFESVSFFSFCEAHSKIVLKNGVPQKRDFGDFAFFKICNFVAQHLFEAIFERASQKKNKWATFEKWKLSDWTKNLKSIFVADMWGPDHPSGASIDSIPFHSTALHSIDPFHCTPLHCIPSSYILH